MTGTAQLKLYLSVFNSFNRNDFSATIKSIKTIILTREKKYPIEYIPNS